MLTRTGRMCDDARQEFVLLSDVLGASSLVDLIGAEGNLGTEPTVLGPFFVDGAPEVGDGADIAGDAPGAALHVACRVLDPDGHPVAGATVDTWQSDGLGFYDVQTGHTPRLRGRLRTGADGSFRFWSVVPASYPIPSDGPVGEILRAQGRDPFRPAHVHFRVTAPGRRELVTHLFVAGDPHLGSDPVFGVRPSLVVALGSAVGPSGARHATLRHDLVLTPVGVQTLL